jgi:polyferredoxin
VRRLLLIAFFLEVGFALIIVPWSTFWERNYFAQALPFVGQVITNDFVRGAVSGLGLVNVLTGVSELASLFMARNQSMEIVTLQRHGDD